MLAWCLLLAACAARNPATPGQPAVWQPPAPVEPAVSAPAPAPVAGATQAPADEKPVVPATSGPAAPAPAATANANADPIVAHVAGKPVYVSELMAQWLYADSIGVRKQLDNLAVERLVVTEATRLGVKIDPELVEKSYERGAKALEGEIQVKRKGVTLDRYVDQYLGLDPKRYRERLRDDALRSLLGERVVRAWLLQNEHAFLRVIVVETEEEKKAVEAELAAGVTFEEAAKKHSKDPSSQGGGRIPPIVRGNTPIASVAFATDVGKVGGPISELGKFLFVRVDQRGVPIEGGWEKLGALVESSLGEQGVDELELEQWRRAMRDRYEIDLSPFLKMAGETPR